jgi:8-amino-7-oxononanoate synthase
VSSFDDVLNRRLDVIRAQGLLRELRRVDSAAGPHIVLNGRELLHFSSNDYLGLASHPMLRQGAIRATEQFGAGSGASRLISGSLAPFHELEHALAAFKGSKAALAFSTGYATAIGTIPALVSKGDVVIVDKLVHACIVDAANLSGARLRVFAHNDLNDLEEKLAWADANRNTGAVHGNVLIVTESVFSMDGDTAPLREIVALKEKFGAWLMVDEAHATGLFGSKRRGLAEALGVGDQIEIQMGTLGKALGASGGYICGSRALIELLVNRARSFIFSTAPVPAAAGAALAAIKLVQSNEGQQRNELLWQRITEFKSEIRNLNSEITSAIIPVILGQESAALAAAEALRERGLFVPAIRYPTVARGAARLRVTLTAAHSTQDVAELASALSEITTRRT